jgi:hypothetical protein
MNADYTATCLTSPAIFLNVNKSTKTDSSYVFKVFYHAHCVFGSISFVKLLKPFTGEFVTFETELRLVILNYSSVSNDALNTSRYIDITMTTGAFSLFPKITNTNTAIHTARCNKLSFWR